MVQGAGQEPDAKAREEGDPAAFLPDRLDLT
jgi:hypothetical protein